MRFFALVREHDSRLLQVLTHCDYCPVPMSARLRASKMYLNGKFTLVAINLSVSVRSLLETVSVFFRLVAPIET